MTHKEYSPGSRWIADDLRVWEKREWGWKFLGYAESFYPGHVISVPSHDWDHPSDIFHEEFNEW